MAENSAAPSSGPSSQAEGSQQQPSNGDAAKSKSKPKPKRGRRGRGKPSGSSTPNQDGPSESDAGQGRRGKNRRGAHFGSRITADGDPQLHAGRSTLQAATNPVAKLPAEATLSQRLTHSLILGERECSICVCNISPKESIYSCPTCHAIDHLHCIKDWSRRSLADLRQRAQLQPQLVVQWRCPSCNTAFPPDEAPVAYKCFCNRLKNPRLRAGQTPHSCGQPCARKRPCGHPCHSLCHPGPCEPCAVLVKKKCWCGKVGKDLRCADCSSHQQRTCGQICGAALDCGLHQCQQECHPGDCGSCAAVREKKCFCGQDTLVEVCFSKDHAPDERTTCYGSGVDSSWMGEYACANMLCPRLYDCGQHACEQPCHPHTSAELEHCPRSPDVLTTCPCSASPQPPRATCTDPIATCTSVCAAPLPCGHACSVPCHTGPHPSCTRPVTVVCRCGSDKQEMPCHQADTQHTCKRICRAMRSCGKHECTRQCCPLSYQEALFKKGRKLSLADVQALESQDVDGIHSCPLVCGKPLACGQHSCQRQDHRGPCGPCLASEFSEISCHVSVSNPPNKNSN